MIEVYLLEVKTNRIDNYDFKNLLCCVSSEKVKEILKIRNDIDKKQTVFADILVRIVASKKTSLPNYGLCFQKNTYGKPYLISCPEIQYNISHSQNVVIVAFSDKSIGVDVERIHKIDMRIAYRYFTQDENHYIRQSNDSVKCFFEIWTKKEAYIKYDGRGLSIPLNSFSVLINRDKYYMYSFKDYIIALYRDNLSEKISVHNLEEDDLYKQANLLYHHYVS